MAGKKWTTRRRGARTTSTVPLEKRGGRSQAWPRAPAILRHTCKPLQQQRLLRTSRLLGRPKLLPRHGTLCMRLLMRRIELHSSHRLHRTRRHAQRRKRRRQPSPSSRRGTLCSRRPQQRRRRWRRCERPNVSSLLSLRRGGRKFKTQLRAAHTISILPRMKPRGSGRRAPKTLRTLPWPSCRLRGRRSKEQRRATLMPQATRRQPERTQNQRLCMIRESSMRCKRRIQKWLQLRNGPRRLNARCNRLTWWPEQRLQRSTNELRRQRPQLSRRQWQDERQRRLRLRRSKRQRPRQRRPLRPLSRIMRRLWPTGRRS
mmetsp:Transcript_46823/g.108780  ORF Transcript_46823/g.108780 Transcript_46823/m.108780 type:complete len:316 (+) Transcript_46823:1970-2917(+)